MPRITFLFLTHLLVTSATAAPVPEPKLTKAQAEEWDKQWAYATGNGNGASELRLVCQVLAEPFGGRMHPGMCHVRCAVKL